MNELLPTVELVARLLLALADHDRDAGGDLQIVRMAPELAHPLLQITIERDCAVEIAARAEHHLGIFGGEISACVGGAGLNDDRAALRRPLEIEHAVHGEVLAAVIDQMLFLRNEALA